MNEFDTNIFCHPHPGDSEMRDLITAKVAELDAKYRRVADADVVPLYPETVILGVRSVIVRLPIECLGDVNEIITKRRTGRYEVVHVYRPDPSDFVSMAVDDSLVDAEVDAADHILHELAPLVSWVIPEGDPIAKDLDEWDELLCLVLTTG